MKILNVNWIPAWHELDQQIEVGKVNIYAVVRTSNSFRFATDIDTEEIFEINGRITRITHSQIGELFRIETSGFSYKFYKGVGDYIQIEAEETPGRIEHPKNLQGYLSDNIFSVELLEVESGSL